MKKLLLIITTIILILNCNAQQFGSITDSRDGQVYITVRIGSQWWMAENLNYYTTEGSRYYDDDSLSFAPIYGRLYAWETANKSCPEGWHLSTHDDWKKLESYMGISEDEYAAIEGSHINHPWIGSNQGNMLKANGHWDGDNSNNIDTYGFSALPSGVRFGTNAGEFAGLFSDIGTSAHFWASEYPRIIENAYVRLLAHKDTRLHIFDDDKTAHRSVRCVEDPIPDSAKYFGQTPPGDSAIIFAPGIISLPNRGEAIITFSRNYDECYLLTFSSDFIEKYYCAKRINNSWTEFTETPYFASFFSIDGKKIIYEKNDDIYIAEDTTGGWGTPTLLPSPINSTGSDFSYSETAEGVIYLCSNRPGGLGKLCEIWRIDPLTNQAVNLGPVINSTLRNVTACIAPDESYLIYTQSNTQYEHLYISFNKGNNEWTTPINMNRSGANINRRFHTCPKLSPDGKYLFFDSHTPDDLDGSEIYWVSTHILDTLKKIAMPTTLVNQVIDKKAMLYPNPTNGHITLSLGTSQNHESLVKIYNLQGTQVFSKTFQNTPSATIDLTGNSAGIYVVKVIADGVSYEEKILKE